MRERLIELICNAKRDGPETGSFVEFLVDYLITNGVVVRDVQMSDKNAREKAELERLESRISALNDTNQKLMESQEIYWKNRVKEFAERLKKETFNANYSGLGGYAGRVVAIADIDNLVKEMTEAEG